MAKTRPIRRHGKSKPPRQGDQRPAPVQMPKHSGKSTGKEAPHSTFKNRTMKPPGSGTHGSGRGVK